MRTVAMPDGSRIGRACVSGMCDGLPDDETESWPDDSDNQPTQ
jgi:hypothetical protein